LGAEDSAFALAGRPLLPLAGDFNPFEDDFPVSTNAFADLSAEDLRPRFFEPVPILETINLIALSRCSVFSNS